MARQAFGDQGGQRPRIRQLPADECYNRTVRHEWLDLYVLETIEEAQWIATVMSLGLTTTNDPRWASAGHARHEAEDGRVSSTVAPR